MFWLLAREVLYLKGKLRRDQEWDVMIDLFMHREVDDKKDGEGEVEEEDEADEAGIETMKKLKDNEGEDEEEGDDDEEEEAGWAGNAGETAYAS